MDTECIEIREYLYVNQSDVMYLPVVRITFGILYSLIISAGVIGNVIVVLAVAGNSSLQSVRNLFIVSLSCSDIIVCIVSGTITPITGFSKIWLFGEHLCYLVPVIQGASLCFSTFTLTAISIDRFILIMFPTARPIQRAHAFPMIFLNVSMALSLSLPLFFKQKLEKIGDFCGEICHEEWGADESLRRIYGTVILILQFGTPLVVITFCYAMISSKLSRGILLRRRESDSSMSKQRKAALKRRLRTNRMLVAMVVVFFCCWMPSVVFNILRDYQWLPSFILNQEYLWGIITHFLSITSTVCNPCLYALLNEQFRVAFLSLLDAFRGRTVAPTRKRRCSRLLSNACDHYTSKPTVTKGTSL